MLNTHFKLLKSIYFTSIRNSSHTFPEEDGVYLPWQHWSSRQQTLSWHHDLLQRGALCLWTQGVGVVSNSNPETWSIESLSFSWNGEIQSWTHIIGQQLFVGRRRLKNWWTGRKFLFLNHLQNTSEQLFKSLKTISFPLQFVLGSKNIPLLRVT